MHTIRIIVMMLTKSMEWIYVLSNIDPTVHYAHNGIHMVTLIY